MRFLQLHSVLRQSLPQPLASGNVLTRLEIPPLCCSLKTKNGNTRKILSLPGTVLHMDTRRGEIKAGFVVANKEGFIDSAANRLTHSRQTNLGLFFSFLFSKYSRKEKKKFDSVRGKINQGLNGFQWI